MKEKRDSKNIDPLPVVSCVLPTTPHHFHVPGLILRGLKYFHKLNREIFSRRDYYLIELSDELIEVWTQPPRPSPPPAGRLLHELFYLPDRYIGFLQTIQVMRISSSESNFRNLRVCQYQYQYHHRDVTRRIKSFAAIRYSGLVLIILPLRLSSLYTISVETW